MGAETRPTCTGHSSGVSTSAQTLRSQRQTSQRRGTILHEPASWRFVELARPERGEVTDPGDTEARRGGGRERREKEELAAGPVAGKWRVWIGGSVAKASEERERMISDATGTTELVNMHADMRAANSAGDERYKDVSLFSRLLL